MIDSIIELYIDPGTGGMLFTVLFGIFGVAVFSLRALLIRMKYRVSGQSSKINEQKIPIVIHCENKRYWNIFEPILNEFEKQQKKIVYLTESEDDPVFQKDYKYIKPEFIGKGNKAISKLNLVNATVLFSTTPSLDVFQWKRSKNVDCYIHIMHAAKDITMYRMYGTDHYDAFILSGELQVKQIRQMEEMRGIKPRDYEICGVPYLDEMKKRVENAGPVPSHERTVLLAPSWGESGILSRFGRKLIDDLISTGYKIIVRPHPQSFVSEKNMLDKLMSQYSDPSKVEWNSDTDNFDVLMRSDVLISDYSGVMFEFAMVFDKPIIYTDTKFDPRPYDADWIEETPWTFSILPELGPKLDESNVDMIKELIDQSLDDEAFRAGREKARKDIWAHIGESAKRSADFIIKKYNETIEKASSKPAEKPTDGKRKKLKFSSAKEGA